MRAGAALSEHPLASQALGECVGRLLEVGGTSPDLLVVLSTAAHLGAMEDVVAAARTLLSPGLVVGAGAPSVLAGGIEVEEHAALAMLALWDAGGTCRPVRVDDRGVGHLAGSSGTLVLFADPFSTDAPSLLAGLDEVAPGLVVTGGLVAAARHRGGNLLLLDAEQHRDGAVGVLLDPSVPARVLVSQGCRPVGEPMTVTAAEHRVVRELAGRPALERWREVAAGLDPVDQQLAAGGLLLGRVMDLHGGDFSSVDVLVRTVLGADRDLGALAVDDEVPVGATVQFQVRDAASARRDLEDVLADQRAIGALVATCTSRGSRLFGAPDVDAAAVADALDPSPVAGMFCAGQFGPVGRRGAVHAGAVATLLLG